MKTALSVANLVVFLFMGAFASAYESAEDLEGKVLFLKKKCNMCHSVESHGIERMQDKIVGADHSDAANTVTADSEWIKRFLRQEELKDGAKHLLKYTGDEQELATILNWVLSLKRS